VPDQKPESLIACDGCGVMIRIDDAISVFASNRVRDYCRKCCLAKLKEQEKP